MPSRHTRRPALVLTVALLAAACATPEAGRETAENKTAAESIRLLRDIAELLPGRYSNHLQWHEDRAETLYDLEVAAAPVDTPDRLVFTLAQSASDGGGTRRFRLTLAPGPIAGNLAGVLQPLGDDGEPRGRCPMAFTGTDVGFTGETDPRTCTFGSDGNTVGLLKEIAFDGSQVIIADRVLEPGEEARGKADQVLHFYRTRTFTGWAGVRDRTGDDWRVARDLRLHSEGGRADPDDAHGRDMGLEIELARVRWREDRPPILRLAVYRADKLVGYAWADEDAREIGLRLDTLQVGLQSEPN